MKIIAMFVVLALSASACGAREPLDFELSDGEKFVRLSGLSPDITLINFWRSDCPPCRREMPVLARFGRDTEVRVVVIALQSAAETLSAPLEVQEAIRSPVISLNGPRNPSGLLARFGNQIGALPYTVILNAERRLCAQRMGEVDIAWLNDAWSRCLQQR